MSLGRSAQVTPPAPRKCWGRDFLESSRCRPHDAAWPGGGLGALQALGVSVSPGSLPNGKGQSGAKKSLKQPPGPSAAGCTLPFPAPHPGFESGTRAGPLGLCVWELGPPLASSQGLVSCPVLVIEGPPLSPAQGSAPRPPVIFIGSVSSRAGPSVML